jgi:hypothetical protein
MSFVVRCRRATFLADQLIKLKNLLRHPIPLTEHRSSRNIFARAVSNALRAALIALSFRCMGTRLARQCSLSRTMNDRRGYGARVRQVGLPFFHLA